MFTQRFLPGVPKLQSWCCLSNESLLAPESAQHVREAPALPTSCLPSSGTQDITTLLLREFISMSKLKSHRPLIYSVVQGSKRLKHLLLCEEEGRGWVGEVRKGPTPGFSEVTFDLGYSLINRSNEPATSEWGAQLFQHIVEPFFFYGLECLLAV